MIALDGDALAAIVRLMGDDVPDGFEELAALGYGPGSAWAAAEPYDGPCPHDVHWEVQCGSCPHGGECEPFPSTFELLVLDYLEATGRRAVDLDVNARDVGKGLEGLPF